MSKTLQNNQPLYRTLRVKKKTARSKDWKSRVIRNPIHLHAETNENERSTRQLRGSIWLLGALRKSPEVMKISRLYEAEVQLSYTVVPKTTSGSLNSELWKRQWFWRKLLDALIGQQRFGNELWFSRAVNQNVCLCLYIVWICCCWEWET